MKNFHKQLIFIDKFDLLDPDPESDPYGISNTDPDPGGDLNTDPPGSGTLLPL